jgi:PEP-CTERM motif
MFSRLNSRLLQRSFLARLLQTTGLSLALMTASAAGVYAETVTVVGDNGPPGGDGESAVATAGSVHPVSFPLNKASATGGNGGAGNPGGNGGAAIATAATAIISGSAEADANANGGAGGGDGGAGGLASASAGATSTGSTSSSATAIGGAGGIAGAGGAADAISRAMSRGSGVTISTATATGGDGYNNIPGGDATAGSEATSGSGDVTSTAWATGGVAGLESSDGSDATAHSNATSGGYGNVTSYALASGGFYGGGFGTAIATGRSVNGDASVFASAGGGVSGGSASASSTAMSSGAGAANSTALSSGGSNGTMIANAAAMATGGGPATADAEALETEGIVDGVGIVKSNAETAKGAMAQATSFDERSSGEAQSTAKTSFPGVTVQSTATAPVPPPFNGLSRVSQTNAITQAGGSGQAFVNPGGLLNAYSFSTGLPDKAYAATLIDGSNDVANALLGSRDQVFGAGILGANAFFLGGGTFSASSTFDFAYRGDLILGLIDSMQTGFTGGQGFVSMEFSIFANGVDIFDTTFRSLSVAESFFGDNVINLGSRLGPNVDLTFDYTLVASDPGSFGIDFVIGGAVPEPSTWAMLLVGFAGLGFVGYRQTRGRSESA